MVETAQHSYKTYSYSLKVALTKLINNMHKTLLPSLTLNKASQLANLDSAAAGAESDLTQKCDPPPRKTNFLIFSQPQHLLKKVCCALLVSRKKERKKVPSLLVCMYYTFQ